jgi:molecular chaperone DnaK
MGFSGVGNTWDFDGETYGPEKVSAIILRKLKKDAEESLGSEITGAVITVPAIFGEAQRTATREAAAIAGLEVINILDEPVAAALNYGLARGGSKRKAQNILVYDLGGGTFDLTVMRVSDNEVTMLYTGGDRRLGGKLWDDQLMQHVSDAFVKQHGSDPLQSPDSRQSLRIAAENAKRQLTQKDKAAIKCDHSGKTLRVEITREQFENLTADLLKRTETICELAMSEMQGKGTLDGWSDIDQVLLVGGSSRMPQVPEMMKRLTGKEPQLFEPDLAVAKGAAIFSEMELLRIARTTGDESGLERHGLDAKDAALLPKAKVTRVCSFALGNKVQITDDGVEPVEYENSVLIEKNSPLPAKNKGTFYTVKDDQRAVLITVLEGEDPDPERCIKVGEGTIRRIPAGLPKQSPIDVTFELTDESLIRVTAVETTHGTSLTFELRRDAGISAAGVQRAAQELAKKTVA